MTDITLLRAIFGAALSALAGLATVVPSAAADDASTFPSRNITLIVPFGAGGPPDSIARVIASGLSKSLGKPVIVENRPGASTGIAAGAVARAAPDGHTLMAVDISFAVTPHIASNFTLDPLKDFKPVGQSAKSVFALLASSSLSTPTLADFIRLTKEKPEAIKIGHTGIGTTPHLAAMTFITKAGINPLLVPYRTVAEATNDTLAGHISAVFSAASTAIGLVNNDKVRILGVTGEKRAVALPNVPTFEENGIHMTGFENGSWYGIVAPANTPDEIVAKLNAALNQVVADKDLKEKLSQSGLELSGGTPQEFRAFIQSQYTYWGETLRAAGVKPEPR